MTAASELHGKNVLLVNSSNHGFEQAIPLGLLAIGTLLAKCGVSCQILELPMDDEEYSAALDSHLGKDLLFIGFSTMCNTLPRTLSLAKVAKQRMPTLPLVLGGPQATAVWRELLERYDFIDFIVLGEAELSLDDLMGMLIAGQPRPHASIVNRQFLPGDPVLPVTPPDRFPEIDQSLYPIASNDGGVAIEVGRGCPYACRFCSTQSFFQRRYRLKPPAMIVAEVENAVRLRKIRHIDFVHDMFCANRTAVESICRAIVEAGLDIKWGCSTRADKLDPDLMAIMADSGCQDLFFGVETASPRMQDLLGKRLDVSLGMERARRAVGLGLRVTLSFIIGFPDETASDLAATVNAVLDARNWVPQVRSVQVHMLAPLPGTELTEEHRETIGYDGHFTDLSSVNHLTEWEKQEIISAKRIFSSFYYFNNPHINRNTYLVIHFLLFYGNRFDEYFSYFYMLFGDKSGETLLRWCEATRVRFMRPINKSRILVEVHEELLALADHLDLSGEKRAHLSAAAAYGLWKSHTAQERPGTIFISQFDFLVPTDRRRVEAEQRYIYHLDVKSGTVRRLPLPNSVAMAFA